MKQYFQMADELLQNSSMQGIFTIMGRSQSNTVFEYLQDGHVKTVTYADYKKSCLAAAGRLYRALCGRRGYICLKLSNGPDWGVAFWAALMAGCKPVMVDAKADAAATEYVIAQAAAVAVICEPGEAAVKYSVPVITPADILDAFAPAPEFVPDWENEVAFCSSGTTRTPSIYVFSGAAVCAQIQSARVMPEYTRDIMYPDSEGRLKILALLPFHHIFGFVAVFLWYTFFGKTLVFLADMAPQTILSTCRKLKVTHIYAVPLLWVNVARTLLRLSDKHSPLAPGLRRIVAYANAEAAGHDPARKPPVSKHFLNKIRARVFGRHVRYMISGGGAVSRETLGLVNAIGYPLYNGYGLTECGVVAVELSPLAAERALGSFGRPLTGVEFHLTDGSRGELLIGGAVMHTGVLKEGRLLPPETQDGFFHTGDLMTRDVSGRYYFSGRVKDVIINAAGENIMPDELENSFASLPYVDRLCVLGVNNGGAYEDITMVLELAEANIGELLKLREAILAANAALAIYKQIKEVLIAREPIPVVNTIKVQRQRLKAALERGEFACDRLNLSGELISPKRTPADLETVARVRRVFAQVLSLDEAAVACTAHFVYDLDGDSFTYAALIAELEQEFGRAIPPEEFARRATVLDFARFFSDNAAS